MSLWEKKIFSNHIFAHGPFLTVNNVETIERKILKFSQ